MFSQPSTLPSHVALGIAAARERPSSLRIEHHHGADLLGSSHLSSAAHAGDDLTEDDVWSVNDTDSLSTDGIVKVPSHDQILPSIRLTNRARPDPFTASSSGRFSSQAHGLAVLSSDTLTGGQAPLGGDIVKPSALAPVVIPSIQTHLDHFNSRHSQGHHRASAPVNVPDWSKITGTASRRTRRPFDEFDDDVDNIMVPPHEMVARDTSASVCFSVHEGLGGTLRGRDLDRLRTAILQKTGFYE
ncbi:hypothetical protein CLOM_g8219 [Closterium sp. NIES-68]|nr:hypothetical protein CLOM_g8219 [Closterium sp. NIES-68]GJP66129.1 hypothetical protein CLOP_g23041 [Closterium sp. NIES-67]